MQKKNNYVIIIKVTEKKGVNYEKIYEFRGGGNLALFVQGFNGRIKKIVSGQSTHFAFTLAEVLITLGIIGIVAALTLPSLINNYKNKAYVNQLKKSVSTIQNGFKMIAAREGAVDLSDTTFGQAFENSSLSSDDLYDLLIPDLNKSFNVVKSYKKSEIDVMHSNRSGNITDADFCRKNVGKVYAFVYKVTNTNACLAENPDIMLILSDGLNIGIYKYIVTPADDSNEAKKILAEIWIDTNGLKGPNQYGYDSFSFMLRSDGNIIPSGGLVYAITKGGKANYSSYYWATGSGYSCKVKGKNYTGYGSGCAASIIENSWKIDYN